jgi:hypothetical protein
VRPRQAPSEHGLGAREAAVGHGGGEASIS